MRILLPDAIEQRLVLALNEAGAREIGGVLMGEHVGNEAYRVQELTVQRQRGTLASFIRTAQAFIGPLKRFFHKTGYHFGRFNYLGEWHSHPSFAPAPSGRDCQTMWDIVEDPEVGANFAVLMIVRLDGAGGLEGTVTAFLPGHRAIKGELAKESSVV